MLTGEYYLKTVRVMAEGAGDFIYYTNSQMTASGAIKPLNLSCKLTINNKDSYSSPTLPTPPSPSPTPTTPIPSPTPTISGVLKSISITPKEAKKNEKINVALSTTVKSKKVMLIFTSLSGTKSNMTVYLKGLNTSSQYFTIPYTTDVNNYMLTYMVITDTAGKEYHFSLSGYQTTVAKFNFNVSINVIAGEVAIGKPVDPTKPVNPAKPEEQNVLYLENEKITADIIKKIKDTDQSNFIITIDANKDPIIKKELFQVIKGTNKSILIKYADNEWFFSGYDISIIKDINVSSEIFDNASKLTGDLSSVVKKGVTIEFPGNGELPGKALIRIKATSAIKSQLGTNKVYVYYYDKNGQKLDKVAMEITLSDDDYYEFYINHNSTYIITTEKVEDEYAPQDDSALGFNASREIEKIALLEELKYKNTIITIGLTTTMIILIIIICLFLMNRLKHSKK